MQYKRGGALFVCYGGGHVASCLPVAEALKSRGWDVNVLALTTAVHYARVRGWEVIGFKDFIEETDSIAVDFSDKLVLDEASSLVPLEESRAYLGLSYQDMVFAMGVEEAASVYSIKGRQAFLPICTMKRIIEKVNPDVIITTASPRAEHAAQIVAQEFGIPRFYILDMADIHMVNRISSLSGPMIVCAADIASKEMLIADGVSAEQVFVTGNPAFDSLRMVSKEAVRDYRRELGISDAERLILWASQPEPAMHPVTGAAGDSDLPNKIEHALRRWVSSAIDARLVVRYHPSEERTFLPGNNVAFSPRSDDVALLLNSCDLLVTMTSTMALQASFLGKPVITVNLSVFSDEFSLSPLSGATGVNDMSLLASTLDEVLKERQGACEDSAGSACSAARVADVVEMALVN